MIFNRIEQVRVLTLRNIQEMVRRPVLWSIVPDPFDLTVSSRARKHYIDSVDYRAREVTGRVNPAIMLSTGITMANCKSIPSRTLVVTPNAWTRGRV